jgi:hypothetical protein
MGITLVEGRRTKDEGRRTCGRNHQDIELVRACRSFESSRVKNLGNTLHPISRPVSFQLHRDQRRSKRLNTHPLSTSQIRSSFSLRILPKTKAQWRKNQQHHLPPHPRNPPQPPPNFQPPPPPNPQQSPPNLPHLLLNLAPPPPPPKPQNRR